MNAITDATTLRAHFGPVSALAENKQLDYLDRHCQAFIAISPFLVLATTDGQGGVDASPRGDAPGFVKIIDQHTLLLPDRPGNRRVDSLRNIVAHPGVGLLFFVPGIEETVRINGNARVITDADLLAQVPAENKIPATGVLVAVTEAFYQCAKALIRSKLWDPSTKIDRKTFPSLGQIIADQVKGIDAKTADTNIADSYRTRLY